MEDLEKREKQERNKGSRSIALPIAAAVAILAVTAIAIVAWGGRRSRVMDRSEAMEHALSDAGLALADVTLTRQELQRDGGRNCYEIEFVSETHVYEYEIDAATGEVRGVSIHALGTEGATASASQGQTGMGQPDAENGQPEASRKRQDSSPRRREAGRKRQGSSLARRKASPSRRETSRKRQGSSPRQQGRRIRSPGRPGRWRPLTPPRRQPWRTRGWRRAT